MDDFIKEYGNFTYEVPQKYIKKFEEELPVDTSLYKYINAFVSKDPITYAFKMRDTELIKRFLTNTKKINLLSLEAFDYFNSEDDSNIILTISPLFSAMYYIYTRNLTSLMNSLQESGIIYEDHEILLEFILSQGTARMLNKFLDYYGSFYTDDYLMRISGTASETIQDIIMENIDERESEREDIY